MSAQKGRLLGIGVGPGDPELITLKALRLLQSAVVVGYFVAKAKANKGHGGNAFPSCRTPLAVVSGSGHSWVSTMP